LALASVALAPAACDSDDETSTSTATTTRTTTTTTATTVTTSSSSAGGREEGGNGGEAAQGGSAGAGGDSMGGASMGGASMGGASMGGSSGTGGGSSSALVPSLAINNLYVDCMPFVPADPIYGWYDALYDNTAGTTSAYADIVSSTLHFGNGTLNWSFAVTPDPGPNVPAGQTASTMHVKTMNTGMGMGVGAPCDYCNGTWSLEVVWSVGSQQFTDSIGPEPVSCVF